MPEYIQTLLATLGGQPQAITFTLDLLLQRGININEVHVIHPASTDSRLRHSLACLNAEFAGARYRFNGQVRYCHLYSHVLRLGNTPLDDITSDTHAEGALDTIYQLIRDLKKQDRCVHLSVTGGRRLMSLIAMEAALLNFTHSDHIWHIYTPDATQRRADEGAIMHASPEDGVRLIERRFVPWGTYFPEITQTISMAQEAQRSQTRKMDALQYERCDQVFKRATSRQRDVLRAFAEGLNIQEVAERLCITTRTVDAHKGILLDLCREAWPIKEGAPRLGYHFLYKTFAPYFDSEEYTPPK